MPRACPICEGKVKFCGSDDGKLVHTLEGVVYQIVNLYRCTTGDCPLHERAFNLHPRFDYGKRRVGADVFRLVAEELLIIHATPGQIWQRLTRKFGVDISERTVARMCDDVANLKAYQVDQKTRELLAADPQVLLGFDGQEPGEGGSVLWMFLDLLKNRVIHTCVAGAMEHEALHREIEEFRTQLGITFVGWVSDKQGSIVKCHDLYYPDVPHQYCQFHFLRNTWKHAEALDSNVFLPLQKALNHLYIHAVSKDYTTEFEGIGRRTVREVFADIDRDFKAMLRKRNKTFKVLRGIWLYDTLAGYAAKMRAILGGLDPAYKFTQIYQQTVAGVEVALEAVGDACQDSRLVFGFFQEIRKELVDPSRSWLEQQMALDAVYAKVWDAAVERGLKTDLPDLRTFLPGKKAGVAEVLGEWCRLWESYRPGLFQYVHFPRPVKTNGDCETSFSKEKQWFLGRVAKKQVGHMVETRGEAYLRLGHCTAEELASDILAGLTTRLLQRLQKEQQARIAAKTDSWEKKNREFDGCGDAPFKFYPEWEGFIVGGD
jgi:hypothetical protein